MLEAKVGVGLGPLPLPRLLGKLTKLSEKSSFGKFDSLPDPFDYIHIDRYSSAHVYYDYIVAAFLNMFFFLGYCDVVFIINGDTNRNTKDPEYTLYVRSTLPFTHMPHR